MHLSLVIFNKIYIQSIHPTRGKKELRQFVFRNDKCKNKYNVNNYLNNYVKLNYANVSKHLT